MTHLYWRGMALNKEVGRHGFGNSPSVGDFHPMPRRGRKWPGKKHRWHPLGGLKKKKIGKQGGHKKGTHWGGGKNPYTKSEGGAQSRSGIWTPKEYTLHIRNRGNKDWGFSPHQRGAVGAASGFSPLPYKLVKRKNGGGAWAHWPRARTTKRLLEYEAKVPTARSLADTSFTLLCDVHKKKSKRGKVISLFPDQ